MHIVFIIDESFPVAPIKNAVEKFRNLELKTNEKYKLTLATFGKNPHMTSCFASDIKSDANFFSELHNEDEKGCISLYDGVSSILVNLRKYIDLVKTNFQTIFIFGTKPDNCSTLLEDVHLAVQIAIMKQQGTRFVFFCEDEELIKKAFELGCDNCVGYNTTEKSLSRLSDVLLDFMNEKVAVHMDINIKE